QASPEAEEPHQLPAPAAVDLSLAHQAEETAASADDANPWMVRTSYGVGAVLAAGVLALLASRRRDQQRLRRPGQRLPLPTGSAAVLEQDIRTVADPLSVEGVDRALRLLTQHCIDTDN